MLLFGLLGLPAILFNIYADTFVVGAKSVHLGIKTGRKPCEYQGFRPVVCAKG